MNAHVICIVLLLATTASGENWPQFRGADRSGRSAETDVPLKWSKSENIAWKTPIPGDSWSSPIVWEDRVFLTTSTNGGASCHVLSLDRKSGKMLWDREVFTQKTLRKEDRNTYATPTPATDGERVYACFGGGSFVALDFAGNVVWTNHDYPFYSKHGLGTSLMLHEGVLVMARDGSSEGPEKKVGWLIPWDKAYVLALDAKTGKQLWKTGRGLSRISHGTPTIYKGPDGRTQVVSEAGDVVQGFDFQTGERLWSSKVIGEGKTPSTIVDGDLVFTAGGYSGDESIKAFRIGGRGELGETNLVWRAKEATPKLVSLILVKPYVYSMSDQGVVTCWKAATGEKVWRQRVKGEFAASPLAAEGRIYFLSDQGTTYVLSAGDKFDLLATNTLDEKVQATPAISHGHVFIRTQSNLFCIGSKE